MTYESMEIEEGIIPSREHMKVAVRQGEEVPRRRRKRPKRPARPAGRRGARAAPRAARAPGVRAHPGPQAVASSVVGWLMSGGRCHAEAVRRVGSGVRKSVRAVMGGARGSALLAAVYVLGLAVAGLCLYALSPLAQTIAEQAPTRDSVTSFLSSAARTGLPLIVFIGLSFWFIHMLQKKHMEAY